MLLLGRNRWKLAAKESRVRTDDVGRGRENSRNNDRGRDRSRDRSRTIGRNTVGDRRSRDRSRDKTRNSSYDRNRDRSIGRERDRDRESKSATVKKENRKSRWDREGSFERNKNPKREESQSGNHSMRPDGIGSQTSNISLQGTSSDCKTSVTGYNLPSLSRNQWQSTSKGGNCEADQPFYGTQSQLTAVTQNQPNQQQNGLQNALNQPVGGMQNQNNQSLGIAQKHSIRPTAGMQNQPARPQAVSNHQMVGLMNQPNYPPAESMSMKHMLGMQKGPIQNQNGPLSNASDQRMWGPAGTCTNQSPNMVSNQLMGRNRVKEEMSHYWGEMQVPPNNQMSAPPPPPEPSPISSKNLHNAMMGYSGYRPNADLLAPPPPPPMQPVNSNDVFKNSSADYQSAMAYYYSSWMQGHQNQQNTSSALLAPPPPPPPPPL